MKKNEALDILHYLKDCYVKANNEDGIAAMQIAIDAIENSKRQKTTTTRRKEDRVNDTKGNSEPDAAE